MKFFTSIRTVNNALWEEVLNKHHTETYSGFLLTSNLISHEIKKQRLTFTSIDCLQLLNLNIINFLKPYFLFTYIKKRKG